VNLVHRPESPRYFNGKPSHVCCEQNLERNCSNQKAKVFRCNEMKRLAGDPSFSRSAALTVGGGGKFVEPTVFEAERLPSCGTCTFCNSGYFHTTCSIRIPTSRTQANLDWQRGWRKIGSTASLDLGETPAPSRLQILPLQLCTTLLHPVYARKHRPFRIHLLRRRMTLSR